MTYLIGGIFDKTKIELADIDLDTEAGQRANILEIVKQKYGYDKVLNICTFKREGTASAIQTICRGMEISIDDAKYLSSLVIKDGNSVKSVKQCLADYGTDSETTKFVNELKKIDELNEGFIESILQVEGKICGRGIHASGVYIFPKKYTEMNSKMLAPNGQPTTQFDMTDSDYMGGLKLDFLTIESLDRIRKNLDILLKEGIVEWQGSLKKTHDKYIHPDVLDMTSPDMFDMLKNGELVDAFQYDSIQGKNAIGIIKPTNFQQIMDGNALMRLSCEGEQPINIYAKHKMDLNIWFKHMEDAGLNEKEIEVLKEHLLKSYGVAPTQESVMRLSMDSRISNFDLIQANKLRKAIAKSKAKHMIKDVYDLFVKQGIANGARELFLNYIWETHIVPQLGYAFSEPHLAGYSLILMQEMNLAYRFGPLYWKVACLSINAGNIGENLNRGADYGAIARAIGGMPQGFVKVPCINKSQMEFIALSGENKAMYSLNAINGIGEDVAKAIIANRPYDSFLDFYKKCVETKLVTNSKVYNLIKAGCFDSLDYDRHKLMMEFVVMITPEKEKLTTANIPKLIEYGLVPDHLKNQVELYEFRKQVFNKSNIVKSFSTTRKAYRMPKELKKLYFYRYYLDFDDAFYVDENGIECLINTDFDKLYKQQIQELVEWIGTSEAVRKFNNYSRSVTWNKYCLGTIVSWEMESISYYSNEHELESIPIRNYMNISNFNELPKEPIVENTYKWRNRDISIYKLDIIAGVVVDKNKAKSVVTISTEFGVTDIKLDRGRFAHYDRKLNDDKSWLTKGNKLVIIGFRRGESFVPKVYKNSPYQHTIFKIEDYNDTQVYFKTERSFAKEVF